MTHYSFITCTQGIFKTIKDKEIQKEITKNTNCLHVAQDSTGKFNEHNYLTVHKTLKLFTDNKHFVKRQHVLNMVAKHMVIHNMLPAICFVLSRKALEQCATEMTTNILEDDSKVPYIVRRECEQIIRKLPNFQEYLNLPEYLNMVSLLEKGVAIHHAGIMPILREMVELLFAKGYIKLLFATETFAVGINMPTKTVLFTDYNKFDGNGPRPLYSHEYTQMAGRAGRRGIDTIGHVIHLTNLFKNMDQTSLKIMMKGKPQTLISKFKISYNLLLNLIDIGETDYTRYAKRSMAQGDIENIVKGYNDNIDIIQGEIDTLTIVVNNCKTPIQTVEQFIQLKENRILSVNKKRKEIDRGIQVILETWKDVEKEMGIVSKYNYKCQELNNLKHLLGSTESTIQTNIMSVIDVLINSQFVNNTDNGFALTVKGHIATNLREVHCLVFSELIDSGIFSQFGAKELVGIFSCFTNIMVPEDIRETIPNSYNTNVKYCIMDIYNAYTLQSNNETKHNIDTGFDYRMHFDMIDYSIKWCECENDIECKQLLNDIVANKDIFLGEFIKGILKINNITAEMEKIAEYLGDMKFLSILKQVPQLTLKYVATNQSLYV